MIRETRTYALHVERYGDRYLALIPALKGCAAWGASYEEAIACAGEAAIRQVENLQVAGAPIPAEDLDLPVSLGVTVRTAIIS